MKKIRIYKMLWDAEIPGDGVTVCDNFCEVFITNRAGELNEAETERRALAIIELGFKLHAVKDGIITLSNFSS